MPILAYLFGLTAASLPAIWLWIFRPYCIRHGEGYTPGAYPGVTMWIDWQHSREIAQRNNHKGMIQLCRAFMIIQIIAMTLPWLAFLLTVFTHE